MSVSALTSPYNYICSYIKDKTGSYPTGCCPTTSFTFNMSEAGLVINTWNYEIPVPTMDDLIAIPYNTMLTDFKLNKVSCCIKSPILSIIRGIADKICIKLGGEVLTSEELVQIFDPIIGTDLNSWIFFNL